MGRQALLDLDFVKEGLDQPLVDVFPKQTYGRVVTLGDNGGKLETRDVQEKNMHGVAEILLHQLAAQIEFRDICLGALWGLVRESGSLKQL